MSSAPELQAYYREAADWDTDRVAQARRSARNAGLLAVVFALMALAAIVAVVALTPLKTVEPFLIRVDNTTGVVDVVPSLATAGEPLGEAVTRYLLSHYVAICERFVLPLAEQDYAECGAFNGARRNQAWARQWAAGNPDSPLNRYRDGTTVRAEVRSVSFLDRANGAADLAQVRFLRATRSGDAGGEVTSAWIATLQYSFGKPAVEPATRRWNPLGFRVLEYRLEPEAADAVAVQRVGVAR